MASSPIESTPTGFGPLPPLASQTPSQPLRFAPPGCFLTPWARGGLFFLNLVMAAYCIWLRSFANFDSFGAQGELGFFAGSALLGIVAWLGIALYAGHLAIHYYGWPAPLTWLNSLLIPSNAWMLAEGLQFHARVMFDFSGIGLFPAVH